MRRRWLAPTQSLVLLALLGLAGLARAADSRSVALVITDAEGAFVPDVRVEELRFFENGEPREILSFERDTRPLATMLVLDTSDGALRDFRGYATDAVEAFLAQLPQGSRTTLWSTGERARKLGELDGDSRDKTVAQAFGPGGTNALLDTLVDAAAALEKQSGRRRALVAVSGLWPGHTSWSPGDVMSRVRRASARVFGVMYREGGGAALGSQFGMDVPRDVQNLSVVGSDAHERALGGLARATGGRFEVVGTAQAVGYQLAQFAGELGGQYRVRFSVKDAKGPRQIDARVLRPGVHWRVAVDSP